MPDSQEKTWRVHMKLGCVNTVRKMSPNWSSAVASQGCGRPFWAPARLKRDNLTTRDVIVHLLWPGIIVICGPDTFSLLTEKPSSFFCKRWYFILALSLLSPSYLPDGCQRSPSAMTNWQALDFSLLGSDREASSFPAASTVFNSHKFSSRFFCPRAQYKAGNINNVCLMKLKSLSISLHLNTGK